jgi:hypothetical protein
VRPISCKIGYEVKPNINSIKVNPQLSNNNKHPVDGALVGAGSLWPYGCEKLNS